MCGIVGGYGDRVEAGVQALIHRGPDAQALARVGALTLGHTRLSIIDPDPRSNQPFIYGDLTLVFNGEIWNYRALRAELESLGAIFHTQGDTEVLAAALSQWGTDALPRLQGMFAAGWTTDGHTLYLARDRFGETPLHVAKQNPFYFASEKKALLAMGCHPRSIADVEPGHYAIVTPKNITMRAYYDAPIRKRMIDRQEAAGRLRQLIGDGATERTISDVPVCTLLSGGIDSAAVAYWLRQSFPDLVAYTAVYNPKSSDLRAARQVASALDIELREVRVDLPSANDLASVIRVIEMDYKAQIEIGWPCIRLAEAMQADGFKVTYSGEGSDELWASYGFAYHALKTQDWHAYRKALFMSQARKNFVRCNKIFMAHSVECRLPFLNTGLVEFALSLPQGAVQDGKSRPKAIIQDAFHGLLPREITHRPKVAFQDGLGIKDAIARSLPSPEKFYRAEYANVYG
jgi:asparagine synthase (glutamine-hydrolysing)